MLAPGNLKDIRPYFIGQIVDYNGTPAPNGHRYLLSRRRWYVVHTEPQQETRVEGALDDLSFGAYLPRQPTKIRMAHERYRHQLKPMISGYVFAGFDVTSDPWEKVIDLRGVLRLFMIDSRPVPVGEMEMQCLREAEAECRIGKVRKIGTPLKAGDCVRVIDGPFMGFLGFVIEIRAHETIIVEIDIFGRMTPVEFRPDQLELVLEQRGRIKPHSRPVYPRPRSSR